MLQVFNNLCDLSVSPCLSCTGESRTGFFTPDMSHQFWVKGNDHLLPPARNALPNAAQAHCPCSTCPSGLPGQPPAGIGACSSSSTRCKTLHFPLLNFMRFQSAQFSSLLRSLWMAVQPSCVSPTASFVPSTDLLRVSSVLSSRSLMKMLNSIGPIIESWGISLLTGLWLDFIPLLITLWHQQFREFSVHLTAHLPKLYFISLSMRMLKETVTKGFLLKSRQITPLLFPHPPSLSSHTAVRFT